jgi:hypothetical protein
MSNPKEKADELIDKMYYVGRYDDKENYNPAMAWERAKQCALIAIDEIRSCINWNHYPLDKEWRFCDEVKQEIEKL